MEIREDVWLSEIFGYGVFKLESALPPAGPETVSPDLRNLIRRHADQHAPAMYYTKVNTDQIGLVREFNRAGLYVVDVNVTLGIDCPPSGDLPTVEGLWVSEIHPEHCQEVLEIARSSFRYSRFHLDPVVPRKIADQVKHDWILNYIRRKRGDRLFVALVDGHPAGFLAALATDTSGARVRVIDLIAVGRAHQNRGVGRALVAFFISYYRGQSDRLEVGTQIANAPSLRLYQKLGFSIIRSAYVMHMHV